MTDLDEFKAFFDKFNIQYDINPYEEYKDKILLYIGGNYARLHVTFDINGKFMDWDLSE